MTPVVVAAGALGAYLLATSRGATASAGPTAGPIKPPPKQVADKSRCEPPDTWFEETTGELLKSAPAPAGETPADKAKRLAKAGAKEKAYGVTEKEWNRLSCSEKKQVMALGPFALNTILLGRGYEAAQKELAKATKAANDAVNGVNKTIGGAAHSVGKKLGF